jgi:hypothetical protein
VEQMNQSSTVTVEANAIHIKLIDVIYGNSSTNMTPNACSRQAHRIADALIAAGLIPAHAKTQKTVSDEDWNRALSCAYSCIEATSLSLADFDNAMQHAFGLLSLARASKSVTSTHSKGRP